jgi:PKD repeat protein
VCKAHDPSAQTPENECNGHAEETVAWVAIARKGDGTVEIDNDAPPTACFSGSNEERTISTDATCSSDAVSSDADLQARWDWNNDGTYGDWSTSLTSSHTHDTSGTKTIGLEIKDEAGDIDTVHEDVVATLSPDACVETPTDGLTVNADAACSSDDLSSDSEMNVRWDWDNDGTYTVCRTVGDLEESHEYQSNGEKTIQMEIEDEHGERSTTSPTFTVNRAPHGGLHHQHLEAHRVRQRVGQR